jgi:hypothetical protein
MAINSKTGDGMKLEAAMNALRLWMAQHNLHPDNYRVTITAADPVDVARIEAAACRDFDVATARLVSVVPRALEIEGITVQFGDKPPGRSDKDFAIEHAGYLADSAERLIALINQTPAGDDMSGVDAQDSLRALRSAIHEFRKRAAKVKA